MHFPVLSMPWLVPPRPDWPGHFYGLWQRGPQGQWEYVRKPTEQLGNFQSTLPLLSGKGRTQYQIYIYFKSIEFFKVFIFK